MAFMDWPIVGDIINNFWFFQTEGVVSLFQEWSTIMIIILFIVPFVLAFVVDQAIHKSKYQQTNNPKLLFFTISNFHNFKMLNYTARLPIWSTNKT